MKIFLSIFFLIPFLAFAQNKQNSNAEDIVNAIKKQVTCEWADKTVDTFKAGNPHTQVTGIVSCMFADMKLKEFITGIPIHFVENEPNFTEL